jgi:hypothetical protein
MSRFAAHIAAVLILSLFIAGCDKCGDKVKLNAPWDSKSCYDDPAQAK